MAFRISKTRHKSKTLFKFLRGEIYQKPWSICCCMCSIAEKPKAGSMHKLERYKPLSACKQDLGNVLSCIQFKILKCCNTVTGYNMHLTSLVEVRHNYQMWLLFNNNFFHSGFISEWILPVFEWIGQGSFPSLQGWNAAVAVQYPADLYGRAGPAPVLTFLAVRQESIWKSPSTSLIDLDPGQGQSL